jgi:hypothetical protein
MAQDGMNLYCDNYKACRQVVYDHGDRTEAVARARGWHLFQGLSLTEKELDVVLCKKCIGARARDLAPAPEMLSGQAELF